MTVPKLLLIAGLSLAGEAAFAQRPSERSEPSGNTPAPTIDTATGTALNKAIEALNAERYPDAAAAIAVLKLDKLSPYERSKVEQILFQIAHVQEKYAEARGHLQNAIDAGGLNEQEISGLRYQNAQLFMAEEKWQDAAVAIEQWLETAANPNSAAYYLLAAAYYQLGDYDRALPPARKAVELMEKPQEGWIGMLLALLLQKEQYEDAVPLLHDLIELAPDKKAYWTQLSGVYGLMEDYPEALAILQLAHGAGLVTEDADIRRLADLQMFNGVPYRCGQMLEAAIASNAAKVDDKLYEKLANCWIAAGELDKAVAPLGRAAEIAGTGDALVRLGELHVQREDWSTAASVLERGIAVGNLKDVGSASLYLGIALYRQKELAEARPWFERARQSDQYRQTAASYLQAIDAEIAAPRID